MHHITSHRNCNKKKIPFQKCALLDWQVYSFFSMPLFVHLHKKCQHKTKATNITSRTTTVQLSHFDSNAWGERMTDWLSEEKSYIIKCCKKEIGRFFVVGSILLSLALFVWIYIYFEWKWNQHAKLITLFVWEAAKKPKSVKSFR